GRPVPLVGAGQGGAARPAPCAGGSRGALLLTARWLPGGMRGSWAQSHAIRTGNDMHAAGWAVRVGRDGPVMRLASDPRQQISLRSKSCEHKVALVFGFTSVGFRERRRRFSTGKTGAQRP